MKKLARLTPRVAGCLGHSEGGGSEEEEEAAGAPAQDPGRDLLAAICERPPSLSPASKAQLQQDEEDASSPEEDADIPSAGSAPAVQI